MILLKTASFHVISQELERFFFLILYLFHFFFCGTGTLRKYPIFTWGCNKKKNKSKLYSATVHYLNDETSIVMDKEIHPPSDSFDSNEDHGSVPNSWPRSPILSQFAHCLLSSHFHSQAMKLLGLHHFIAFMLHLNIMLH